jgi:hypothetical protein
VLSVTIAITHRRNLSDALQRRRAVPVPAPTELPPAA